MADQDLYTVLGVPRDATKNQIRDAYRKLARRHHPDVNPNDPGAEERFKEISAAYSVLSDDEKRPRYDEFGMQGLADGFDPERARGYQQWASGARQSPHRDFYTSDVDLDDLLSNFFGGQRPGGPARGADARAVLDVDFLDAARGAEVPLQIAGRSALRVRIPSGADEGTRIRLAGQGTPGRDGGPPGDLYLTLHVRPHPYFTRQGRHLHVDVPVTIPELVLGASVDVPTPNGALSVKVAPGTPNGRTLRLRRKGIKPAKGAAGDLFARLVCVLPEGDVDQLRELAEAMQPLYEGQDPRASLKGKP